MKIAALQYAKTLHEITENKSSSEIDEAVNTFAKFLIKNNQAGISGKVIEKFQEIYNAKNRIVEAEVASRTKLEGKTLSELDEFIKEKYKAKKVVLKNNIDEKIIGGIVIRVNDEILDGTINRQLTNLKNKLIY